MARRNPSLLTVLLLGGGAGVAYYLWTRRSRAAPGPTVHEPPAAEQPPPVPQDEIVPGGCYVADRPGLVAGYEWVCRNGVWKKRRTTRTPRTAPTPVTLSPMARYR